MITKRRLKKYIKEVDSLISLSTESSTWYQIDPGALLTRTVLRLGFKPKLIPTLQFYLTAKECSGNILDLSNTQLRTAYFNDLKNIRAMLDGIYYNTWRYNLRGLDKIASEVISFGSALLSIGSSI